MNEMDKLDKKKLSFEQYYSGANSAQKEAIESDSALTVVAASAGTGKTFTLAQKVAYILCDEEKNVASDEILVLTFTIKAAQEMQERIKSTLAKWYNAKYDELEKKYGAKVAKSSLTYLKEKLDSLDDAYISNLHSFSKRVISEGGLSLDIDPGATIIVEPQVSRWFSNLEEELSKGNIEGFISALPEDPAREDISQKEAEEFFAGKENIIKEVLQFYNIASISSAVRLLGSELPSHGLTAYDLWHWQDGSLSSNAMHQSPYTACQYIKRLKLLEVLHDWQNATSDYLAANTNFEEIDEKHFDQICLFDFAHYVMELENLESEEAQDEFLKKIELLLASREGASPIRKGTPAANFQQYLPQGTFAKWKDNYNEKIKPFCDLANLDAELEEKTFLERICAVLWQAYNSYKKENNLMELSELVQNAKKLFERETKYSKKFKYIFVDEFQDTDPLQDSLINALWHKPEDENDIENHLFIVGDFKQSIYSFRGAEPSLLLNYKNYALNERNQKLACFIALSENYRTDCDLIHNINDFFSHLWSGERGNDFVYGIDDRLICPAVKETGATQDIVLCRIFWCYGENAKTSIAQLRSTRSDAVAEDIITKAKLRGDKWSDFCVLVRGRNEFTHLEASFNKRKIPFVLCEAKNFFGKIETEDVVNYLSLLDDNDNMTALAGWLMSPISAVGQEKAREVLEVAERRIKEYEKGNNLGTELDKKSIILKEVFSELLPDAAGTLQNASHYAKIMGASAAIEKLLEKQENLLKYVSENSRKRLLLNLIHIKEICKEFEECFSPSLAETVTYLQDSLNKNISREEPDLAELGSNAVTVMTIHASKGLEFDNVYLLLDKNDSKHTDAGRIVVSNKFGCLASSYVLGGKETDATLRKVSNYIRTCEESAEAERLVYVAFTRAKKTLTIAMTDKNFTPRDLEEKEQKEQKNEKRRKKIENGTYSIIDEIDLFHTYSSVERRNIAACDISCTVLDEAKQYEVLGQDIELVTKMPKRLDKLTASAYSLFSWCPVAYRSSFRQGKTLVWHGENGEGSDFGTACHAVLRRWNFVLESLYLLTSKFKQRNKIYELLTSFAKTKTFKGIAELVASGKVIREAPFDVELKYGKERLHMVGVIDLLWQDEAGFHIRDWKTTEEENAPDGFYQKQLDFYALALHEYMKDIGKSVAIDAGLIYLSSENETKLTSYKPSDLETIRQNVIDCSVFCAGSIFKPQQDKCNSCPMASSCLQRKI
ncbi:MAG: UvrD-helicase domain-containing protein [Synergistaceae bacterium]|nr:UvrD-helicase domain-containing protein [Synergistaceae bacterium]